MSVNQIIQGRRFVETGVIGIARGRNDRGKIMTQRLYEAGFGLQIIASQGHECIEIRPVPVREIFFQRFI